MLKKNFVSASIDRKKIYDDLRIFKVIMDQGDQTKSEFDPS